MSIKISEKIYTDIQRDIIQGVYKIHSKLPPERDLADRYGANRFAIREAIAMLTNAGFVETRPQSGTYVKDFDSHCTLEMLARILLTNNTIDPKTLKSLLSFRAVNETLTTEKAASLVTEEDIEFLSQNLREKEKNLHSPERLAELDYEFHYRIVLISTDIMIRLIFTSMKQVYIIFTGLFYSLEGAPQQSLALNRKLLGSLAKKDPELSRNAMKKILSYGERRLHEISSRRTR
ncbi:MAG TPA: FadR/GntR family transcriptional regulator [Spirochaetota bacterium]|nr:FadR/GntR family transcriptional regulator [Spirochaetota bacterium]HPQ55276.1 FadR/GntR family transcriptional regulator [Spirochaetota bacterium]